jgi:tetratricopeptide (TPR) repeat protein
METSVSLFEGILAGSPSPGTLFIILSRMKEEGLFKRVIQECIKALGAYPHDIPIRNLLAETYLESGQLPQAESELNRVIALIDDLVFAYRLQTEILVRQNRQSEAIGPLKLYLAHRPDDTDASRLLEALQTPEEIIDEQEPAMGEEFDYSRPTDDEKLPDIATPTLAEIYYQQGQIQEAIDTYENVISRNPEDLASRERLVELKGFMEKDLLPEDLSKDVEIEKKLKIISILEDWLASFQEKSGTGMTADQPG